MFRRSNFVEIQISSTNPLNISYSSSSKMVAKIFNEFVKTNTSVAGWCSIGSCCVSSYEREGLVLGQLLGNQFTVTLRGVVADSEDTIKTSAIAFRKQGFINNFGLQVLSLSLPTPP
ncbi:unnamed protein product [Prunus brigantina]